MGVSVAAIILREGLVLVARRDRTGPLGGLWEFPGGKVEEGESEPEALEREFLEEFGASIQARRRLGETSFMHKGKDRALVAWLADLPEGERLELREHLECRWLKPREIGELDLADSDRKLLPLVEAL
ncbi:MAG: NUDIX domain-containing protein [Spirochaetaceae bacterium]|nr:NUDIX domain-containing protein [Spirochaetaceae bacterium]